MKATGIVRRVDDLGRIVIPKEIRRTLRIREGDPLEIYTEKDGGVIFRKYSPMGDLQEFAGQMCESISVATGHIAAIADRDGIIALHGVPRKELLDKPNSPELELPELKLPREGAEPQAFVVICLDKNLTDSPAAFQRDVGIVAQTMFLAAGELGLNGCMIGSFEAGKLKTLLDLPENLAPQLLLALGEGTDNIVVTDVGPDGNINYFRDEQDVHYVPKRTLEDLIING